MYLEWDIAYDPSVDATVRVEAGRRRSRLRDYYADQGRNHLVVNRRSRRRDRATFTERSAGATGAVAQTGPGPGAQDAHELMDEPGWPADGAPARSSSSSPQLPASVFGNQWTPHVGSAANQPKVLAVLPFSNRTGADADSYLTEGAASGVGLGMGYVGPVQGVQHPVLAQHGLVATLRHHRGGRRSTARNSPRRISKISLDAPPLMKVDVTGSPRPGRSWVSIQAPRRSSSHQAGGTGVDGLFLFWHALHHGFSSLLWGMRGFGCRGGCRRGFGSRPASGRLVGIGLGEG